MSEWDSSQLENPFVGRRRDLAELVAVVERAAAGRGALVVVTGDAGIGKTRVVEEAAVRGQAAGFQLGWAACTSATGSPPFWPWVQIVRPLLATEPDLVGTLGRLQPQLGRLLPELPDPEQAHDAADPDLARVRLFDAVGCLLRSAAARRPRLLVIDDLHWADAPSLHLLAFLAPQLRGARIVVLATHRAVDEQRGHPLSLVLPELLRHARTMALAGLSPAEVGELVTALSGEPAPRAFAAALHERTGGNPLFAREVLRLWGDTDLAAVSADDVRAAVPQTVSAVLAEQAASLSAPCRCLLTVGAVLGTSFGVNVLAEAAALSQCAEVARDRALPAVLYEAVAAGLLHPAGIGRYRFPHPLVRDALYTRSPPADRAALHLAAGGALERVAARGGDVQPAELAHHFMQALPGADAAKAGRYAAEAGARAMAQLAYEEAARLYAAALAAGELAASDTRVCGADVEGRADLLLAHAEALAACGDAEQARAAQRHAADLARAAGRGDLLARAALGMGSGPVGFEVPLGDREQIGLLQEASEAVGDDGPELRAMVVARLSVALSLVAPAPRRRALSEQAVALARGGEDSVALASALAAHCDVIAGPADAETRLALTEEIIALAGGFDGRGLELLGRRLRLVALLETGDMAAADLEIEAYDRGASELRQPLYSWFVPLWRGMRALTVGRTSDCETYLAEARAVGAKASSGNAAILTGVQRWFLLSDTGRPQEALAVVQDLLDEIPERGAAQQISLALALAAAGRRVEARAHLDTLTPATLGGLHRDSEWLATMAELTLLIGLLGGHPAAGMAYDVLQPHSSRFVVEGIGAVMLGSVERYLGVLAAVLGRPDDAAVHFSAAVAANGRLGAPLLVAATLRDAGTVLHDDVALAEARALFTDLGIEPGAAHFPVPVLPAAGANVFRCDGELWTLIHAGRMARLRDAKGLRDLARLMRRPGREVHVLDLVPPGAIAGSAIAGERLGEPGDLGSVLDRHAREAYQTRLAELEAEIAQDTDNGDGERVARARAEQDALVEQLVAAYGLGGRPRRCGDPAERARSTVTRRIRDALGRIEQVHPELGRHLRRSVRTGIFCCYEPDQPIDWSF